MISRRTLLATRAALARAIASPRRRADLSGQADQMIVPFPPGGPIDTMARLAGKFITDGVGQQVVVENRPGAGSTIGSQGGRGRRRPTATR